MSAAKGPGSGPAAVLEARELRKAFGGVVAVDGVSFALEQGEIRAFIGPNGAGKSTLFDLLSGWIRPDAGSVRWLGEEVTGLPSDRLALRGVGRTFQRANHFPGLSVLENVLVAVLSRLGRGRGSWRPLSEYRAERGEAEALLEEVGLAGQGHRLVRELPYGDQKRLDVAIGLALRPRLLILDEPLAGLAPSERGPLLALVRRLAEAHGLTVLFSEHDMDSVLELADVITVLHRGRVLAEGAPAEVVADESVRAAFLGGAWEGGGGAAGAGALPGR
ncbi:MAG: ABC transporter ATP-binding protein [Firmicutes bacterium]|nr:ABC transporter ATP-binding protein [Bacillota bacterium]